MTRKLGLAAFILAMAATAAEAHTGSHAAGFAHPFTGYDHLVAMVAAGVLAARLGGNAVWIVPTSFVSMMALGGLAGMAGVTLPLFEAAIFASIFVLGAAALFARNVPPALAAGFAGFFAIFHGFAHGAEIPADAAGLPYAAGFLAATALLHFGGIGLGLLASSLEKKARG
jgi:urease accessory protein